MSKPKKITFDERVVRGESSEYVIENYLTSQVTNNISVAISRLNGKIPKTKNIVSDRVYYFLEGMAYIIFDDENIEVKKGDVLYIPKNTFYTVEGTFEALLVNTPSFQINNEIVE